MLEPELELIQILQKAQECECEDILKTIIKLIFSQNGVFITTLLETLPHTIPQLLRQEVDNEIEIQLMTGCLGSWYSQLDKYDDLYKLAKFISLKLCPGIIQSNDPPHPITWKIISLLKKNKASNILSALKQYVTTNLEELKYLLILYIERFRPHLFNEANVQKFLFSHLGFRAVYNLSPILKAMSVSFLSDTLNKISNVMQSSASKLFRTETPKNVAPPVASPNASRSLFSRARALWSPTKKIGGSSKRRRRTHREQIYVCKKRGALKTKHQYMSNP